MNTKEFLEVQKRCSALAETILSKQDQLFAVLSAYESYHVFQDEVVRSISCLKNIGVEKKYFGAHYTSWQVPVS